MHCTEISVPPSRRPSPRQPLVPVLRCGGAWGLGRSHSQAVKSADYRAIWQCMLELLHPIIRDLSAAKGQSFEFVQALKTV